MTQDVGRAISDVAQPHVRHQEEAIDALLKNQERSGIFHLPTGSGKTRVAIELIARRLKNP